MIDEALYNLLRTVAISELLEMIGRSSHFLAWSIATALHSDINQTAGSGGSPSMWENRCMHATVCLLCAGQPGSAGHAAKLGQFKGQFSWVKYDPIVRKGLTSTCSELHNYGVCMSSSTASHIITYRMFWSLWSLYSWSLCYILN